MGPRPLRRYRTRLITDGLGVEMVQIPGSTNHNDAADDEDAHLGDCEASAIRGYPLCGASVAGPATPRCPPL